MSASSGFSLDEVRRARVFRRREPRPQQEIDRRTDRPSRPRIRIDNYWVQRRPRGVDLREMMR